MPHLACILCVIPLRIRHLQAYLFGLCAMVMGGMNAAHGALGDTTPAVNTIDGGTNFFNLNFGSPALNQQIAYFVINSNDVNGFQVTFTFSNLGNFRNAVGIAEFAPSSLVLNGVTGTWGTGMDEPVNETILLDGSGSWTWRPALAPDGGPPSVETNQYVIEIKASWPEQSGGIAGLYMLSIDAVISSGP